MTMLSATVIIPSRSRAAELSATLKALDSQIGNSLEVIVVDDSGSAAAYQQTAQAVEGRAKLVRADGKGPGTARNKGAMLARGEFLLFTDDDCEPAPEWAAKLIERLSTATDPLMAVGGRTVAAGNDLYSRYYDLHRILDPMPHDPSHPERIPYMVTANCGIRRETFFRIGGFDEDIPFAGGEDVGLSLKLIRAGGYIEREPGALVRHRFRPGLDAMQKMFEQYGKGGRHVVDRYLPLQTQP